MRRGWTPFQVWSTKLRAFREKHNLVCIVGDSWVRGAATIRLLSPPPGPVMSQEETLDPVNQTEGDTKEGFYFGREVRRRSYLAPAGQRGSDLSVKWDARRTPTPAASSVLRHRCIAGCSPSPLVGGCRLHPPSPLAGGC